MEHTSCSSLWRLRKEDLELNSAWGSIARLRLLQKGDRSWRADTVVRRACCSAEYPSSAPSTQAGQLTGADNSSSRGIPQSLPSSEGTSTYMNTPMCQIDIIKKIKIFNKPSKNRWRREGKKEQKKKAACSSTIQCCPRLSFSALLSAQELVLKPELRLLSKLGSHTA